MWATCGRDDALIKLMEGVRRDSKKDIRKHKIFPVEMEDRLDPSVTTCAGIRVGPVIKRRRGVEDLGKDTKWAWCICCRT